MYLRLLFLTMMHIANNLFSEIFSDVNHDMKFMESYCQIYEYKYRMFDQLLFKEILASRLIEIYHYCPSDALVYYKLLFLQNLCSRILRLVPQILLGIMSRIFLKFWYWKSTRMCIYKVVTDEREWGEFKNKKSGPRRFRFDRKNLEQTYVLIVNNQLGLYNNSGSENGELSLVVCILFWKCLYAVFLKAVLYLRTCSWNRICFRSRTSVRFEKAVISH